MQNVEKRLKQATCLFLVCTACTAIHLRRRVAFTSYGCAEPRCPPVTSYSMCLYDGPVTGRPITGLLGPHPDAVLVRVFDLLAKGEPVTSFRRPPRLLASRPVSLGQFPVGAPVGAPRHGERRRLLQSCFRSWSTGRCWLRRGGGGGGGGGGRKIWCAISGSRQYVLWVAAFQSSLDPSLAASLLRRL